MTVTESELRTVVRNLVSDDEKLRAAVAASIRARTDFTLSDERMAILATDVATDILEFLIRAGWRLIPAELVVRSIMSWRDAQLAGEDIHAHISAGNPPDFVGDERFRAIEDGCVRLGEILHECARLTIAMRG